ESVTKYRKAVPPNVAAAVAKALEKLPADRFESARAFAEALVNRTFTSAMYSGPAALVPGSRFLVPAVTIAALSIVVALFGWLRPLPSAPVIRHVFTPPAVPQLAADLPVPTPSPDGSFMVFHGPVPGSSTVEQLWIQRRDQISATPIIGTTD